MVNFKYLQKLFFLLLMAFSLSFVCVACSDDEEDEQIEEIDENSGIKGWYTNLNDLGKQSDFDEINKAIRNREVLSSYRYGGETHEYVASRDLFINSNGRFNDSDAYYGRLRFSAPTLINVIRILDEQTLVFYVGGLYEDGAYNDGEALYTFYAGNIFGNMTYYGTPTYYTYAKVENKLVVTNGDIYTITSSGLIKEGSSDLLSKYDPKKKETEEDNGNGNKEEGGANSNDYYTGIVNGHKYVDLGLSVKWATCNVGASSPEGYGDYFAWGETTTKSSYSSSNSTTYGLSTSTLKSRGIIGSDGNLTAAYDAATANWGNKWRMPTLDEIKELVNICNSEWSTQNGVKGRKVTGPNGNSIFLPAAGYRGTDLFNAGSFGYYWSATPYSGSYSAYGLYSSWGSCDWFYVDSELGYLVRPVSD